MIGIDRVGRPTIYSGFENRNDSGRQVGECNIEYSGQKHANENVEAEMK